MNFLAHAHLAGGPKEFTVGSVVGEYVKGSATSNLPLLFGSGVKHHRLIDVYTDQHDFVVSYKGRVDKRYRRYCGIVLDIYCDYLLMQNWGSFCDESVDGFIAKLYRGILEHSWRVPEKYQLILNTLVEDDWLSSYSSIDGICSAVQRIEKRLGRDVGLEHLLNSMHSDEELKNSFVPFYSDLSIYAVDQKRILINQ
ncbi:ACP phosphodiesterase [Motilimonas cestriensis]|uniref:ACP phosphodiesterase n=1 Tax=Motilimonas cestriensis TaxID=2742685 RepID=A0ABS8WE88_9GAMM|nr:ACP phosphodiesterase [Motilimonas cestriensis]MCE2597367.1 ACP phosphodiesterase [Motilimonas cestriensis]